MAFSLRIGFLFVVLAILPIQASARPTVGLLLKAKGVGSFWGAIEEGARDAAQASDVELIVKSEVEAGNFGAQLKLLEGLVNQKIDALVVTPTNPERLVGPLMAQAAKGLKIVIAEGELPAGSPFPFVGYDQRKLARESARAFSAFFADGDEVTLFRGSMTDQVLVQRDKIILSQLREAHPKLHLYADAFAVSDELGSIDRKAELMLQKHPASKLFIATSTLSTDALIGVVKKSGNANPPKIAGFGTNLTPEAVEAIESGALQAFVAQVPRDIGYKSVMAAVALIRGETVPARTDISFVVVTKANLSTPAIQALKTGQ